MAVQQFQGLGRERRAPFPFLTRRRHVVRARRVQQFDRRRRRHRHRGHGTVVPLTLAAAAAAADIVLVAVVIVIVIIPERGGHRRRRTGYEP